VNTYLHHKPDTKVHFLASRSTGSTTPSPPRGRGSSSSYWA